MPKRKKTPFCSLQTVFNHPDITSICQRVDLIVDLLHEYDHHEPFKEKLTELAIELQDVVIERAFKHMDREAAEEFLEEWDQLSASDRLTALLSIHHRNIASAQQGGV